MGYKRSVAFSRVAKSFIIIIAFQQPPLLYILDAFQCFHSGLFSTLGLGQSLHSTVGILFAAVWNFVLSMAWAALLITWTSWFSSSMVIRYL